ncbi:MAG: hypothetical protein JKY37_20060 [Nannocystaceae bacterium]|nr:hypothetical protein [Nannocystaceae bacterium]
MKNELHNTIALLTIFAPSVSLAGCAEDALPDAFVEPVAESDGGQQDRGTTGAHDSDSDPEPGSGGDTGPEEPPEVDLSCATSADCNANEACINSLCQMPRCTDGPYESQPPLGQSMVFSHDHELLLAGGSMVRVYDGDLAPSDTWSLEGDSTRDIAAGAFTGMREQQLATALDGGVLVRSDEGDIWLPLSFSPNSVAAGDVDADGRDELIAMGADGELALCEVEAGDCETWHFDNTVGLDVTVGDFTGSGKAQVVLLVEHDGVRVLQPWSPAEPLRPRDGTPLPDSVERIDAGRLDGGQPVDIASLDTSGVIRVHRFHDDAFYIRSERAGPEDSRDIAVADLNADKSAALVVLSEGQVHLYNADDLVLTLEETFDVAGASQWISGGDLDGDSVMAMLVGPLGVLVPGRLTPVIVGHFPPYDAVHSTGTSSMLIGDGSTASNSLDFTISTGTSVSVGVTVSSPGAQNGLPIPSVSASVSVDISAALSQTFGHGESIALSKRVSAAALPEHEGTRAGVVYLSCTCYHVYEYALNGGDADFVTVLPVGGTVTAWSVDRYNAMALVVGDLPVIDIPYIVGDPVSYPSAPQRANGEPIAKVDMVFPEQPSLAVSDIGSIGWSLSVAEDETTSTSLSTTLTMSGELVADPLFAKFKFGASASFGAGVGKSLTVGSNASFIGYVPPILNDPATPLVDEYLEHGYGFSPYVYREHYLDSAGEDAAYYVMSYAVDIP